MQFLKTQVAKWRTSLAASVRSWLGSMRRPKTLGERGEAAAARHLKRLGYHILGRGVDTRHGEIDIIAVDRRTIVFVEVKTRHSGDAGRPSDAVDDRKQERLTRAALSYLKSNGLLQYSSRFDVLAITWPENAKRPQVEHFVDAFPAAGSGQFFR